MFGLESELPQIVQTAQNPLDVNNQKLSSKLISFFKRSQFYFRLNTVIMVKVDVFTYEKASLLIGGEFTRWMHSVFRIEKKFSTNALSYGFPRLDIDGAMPYDLVSK